MRAQEAGMITVSAAVPISFSLSSVTSELTSLGWLALLGFPEALSLREEVLTRPW